MHYPFSGFSYLYIVYELHDIYPLLSTLPLQHQVRAEAQAHWRMFEREALLHALDDAWCDLLAQLDGLKSATNIRCGCRD